MGLSKQAKTLTKAQIAAVTAHIGKARNGLRNQVILGLSVKAGLRAKEIANLKWSMVLESDGEVGQYIRLTNDASKGRSGRIIPLNKELRSLICKLKQQATKGTNFAPLEANVIVSERSKAVSAQVIVNMFQKWYRELGLIGCSSHSGRRTFITNAAKKITTVGGSLRDVQFLAGHSSLNTTQRYIEGDSEARARIVDII